MINFKWYNYGKLVHMSAAVIHITYVLTFLVFVDRQYLHRDEKINITLIIIMFLCNFAAFCYDTRQLIKQGFMYFFDPWNYYDQLYIWSGFLNLYLQADFNDEHSHFDPLSQSVIIFFSVTMLIKTFFFMRIFE